MDQQQRIKDYPVLTAVLMHYGWFISPYITGAEHDLVKKLVAHIQNNPPPDAGAKRAIEDKIHHEFLDVVFSAQVRARYVCQALRTPHIREYSHLYESAVFAYYKREYAGAVCLLLTALEGVLLSINGWRVGSPQRKPTFAQLKNTIAALPLLNINPEMNAIQQALRDALSQFVSKWLYEDTSNADFTLSVLNRHYVLHGMDSGNFYRPHDIHRLLMAFDLLVDLMAMVNGTYRPIVEKDVETYEERRAFYENLRGGMLTVAVAANGEQILLKQHPNYVAPVLEACVELRLKR